MNERDGSTAPVDGGVMQVQPRHTEDGIVTTECSHGEINGIGVRRDTDGDGRCHTDGSLKATISECDSIGRSLETERRGETGDERLRDEVAGRTAIHEDDGRAIGDEAGKFDETTAGGGELVDLQSW